MKTEAIEESHLLADLTIKKVGCVLLQAAFGGSSRLAQEVGHEHWFLAPTKDMKLYKIRNREEELKIIKAFNK